MPHQVTSNRRALRAAAVGRFKETQPNRPRALLVILIALVCSLIASGVAS